MIRPLLDFARVARSPALSVPASLRAPFGWPTMAVGPNAPLTLEWSVAPNSQTEKGSALPAGWLCLVTSVDDREEKIITVQLARSSIKVGELDLRFSPSLTPCRLRLERDTFGKVRAEGITLTLTRGTRPLWWIAPGLPSAAERLAPHLLADEATERSAEFFRLLASPASLQPFGWMEGCVLDALHDLAAESGEARYRDALSAHLRAFISDAGQLTYENPRGAPADGTIGSIETTLPFAVLAQLDPGHPLLELALAFWQRHTHASGAIQDGDVLSAEGNYTVAYPLAVIAAQRGDRALAQRALAQLRLRRERLWSAGTLALRCSDSGERTFGNWTRGSAWYFLGLVRTLEHLTGHVDIGDLVSEVQATAAFVRSHQRPDRLWGSFLDDQPGRPDASGSAGIAAALARGVRAGWLDTGNLAAARRTWERLQSHLTPDGYLDGAAPSNRGGENLQRSDYRVLSPMGMGLMGQLAAALGGEINLAQALSMRANDSAAVVG